MERQIKFRGKYIISNEWVFGKLLTKNKDPFIVREEKTSWGFAKDGTEIFATEWSSAEVVPESVGQFTGFKDETEKEELYEGDLVQDDAERIYEIAWCNEDGRWKCISKKYRFALDDHSYLTIKKVGNKFDNPELLK